MALKKKKNNKTKWRIEIREGINRRQIAKIKLAPNPHRYCSIERSSYILSHILLNPLSNIFQSSNIAWYNNPERWPRDGLSSSQSLVSSSFPHRFDDDRFTVYRAEKYKASSAKISRGWIITVAAVSILQPCSLCVCKLLKRSCKARKSPKGGGQRSGREIQNAIALSPVFFARSRSLHANRAVLLLSFFLLRSREYGEITKEQVKPKESWSEQFPGERREIGYHRVEYHLCDVAILIRLEESLPLDPSCSSRERLFIFQSCVLNTICALRSFDEQIKFILGFEIC